MGAPWLRISLHESLFLQLALEPGGFPSRSCSNNGPRTFFSFRPRIFETDCCSSSASRHDHRTLTCCVSRLGCHSRLGSLFATLRLGPAPIDRKSTRLNSSHVRISYA